MTDPTTIDAAAIYRAIQGQARSQSARTGRPVATGDLLTRHALESFLTRLTLTEHAESFVLKGGVLLSAYDVRRPTRDLDSEAVDIALTAERITQVVRDVVAVAASDGVVFDTARIDVAVIRDDAAYSGLRMRVPVTIATWKGTVAWDISTGDPIVPEPHHVTIPRVLGDPITVLGYRPENVIAEKGVTILERGTTSTRWRDYVDIVQLTRRYAIDPDELRHASQAVATYRGVTLTPITPAITGYGAVGQAKWAAWRRKERLDDISDPDLDTQMRHVADILDPVFAGGEVGALPLDDGQENAGQDL